MKRFSAITMGLLVVALTVAGCAQLPQNGWVTLIDGDKGLENFNQVGTTNWGVVDGVLQADKRTSKSPAKLVTKDVYKDFEIRVEFWASHDVNSGVFLRCQNPTVITDSSCYEVNINDQRKDPTYGTGAIMRHAPVPVPIIYKAGGKWNTYEIYAKGSEVTAKLNGVVTASMQNSQFASGLIALEHAQGVIKFRKVQIKPL